ncbi:carboxypeptidase-like regulatory domain-containing protein [Solirubrobacter soli]|uniref:carboxypeptidase-like regulatory domain-containing protein n=1 Tax=Solirubrobacter soli TaxID=363832 RepID=UPI0012F9FB96|nr:hypothetical protein [Solirubrobacter soli]
MDRRIGRWMATMAVGVGVAAAPAQAGTYDVYACGTSAGKFANHSWEITSNAPQFATGTCSTADANPSIFLSSNANRTYDQGWGATMTFRAPTGATIADFSIHRYLFQFNPVDNNPGKAMLFDLGQLGPTAFELTGQHSASGSIDREHWYNLGQAAENEATITRASFPALAGYRGDATFLRWTIGCEAAQGCALWTDGAGRVGSILSQIFGASVTVNDPTKPQITDLKAAGLLVGGAVAGDEPVLFDANDNAGIRSAQLVDVTPGGDPEVVGQRDFACDFSYASPCPQAQGAQVVPAGLPAGQRQLRLRVTDAGGNVTESDPFAVGVGGPVNGAGAEPGAKLTARFASNRRGTLVLGFGKRARITGTLTTAAGAPIANATLQVLDRELRTGTQYRQRLEVTTDADGRFSVLAGKGAARAIRFEYRWRRMLAQPGVARRVELRVQAGATLSVTPRQVGAGGRIRLAGRLRGLPMPRSGKVVELQAFERGKWRTFRSTRARASGRFATSYYFQRAASGRSFLIRARVRRDDSYPYYLGYSPRVRVRVR